MNLELYNILLNAKEFFWKFYFYPLVILGVGIVVLGALHQLNSLFIFILGISSFCVYNLLFFFWFGEREKHFHQNNE